MRLAEIAKQLGGSLSPSLGDGPKITGVHLDSRQVGVGDLFAALPGAKHDARQFVASALERGAAAILTPVPLALHARATQWIHPDARRVAGEAAARVYGEPSHGMLVIGVTGTNGKTTTSHLVGQLLRAAGRRPAVLGTTGHRLADGRLRPTAHTTPDAPTLQRLVRDHRRLGGDSVVLEASSHALDQERTAGLAFDVAVFTNLTRDHLDYHVDLDRYAAAKEKLFLSLAASSAAVVNADDPASDRMARAAQSRGARVITYSARLRGDLCASQLKTDLSGTELVLNGMGISRARLHLPLAGRHNVENALAAAAVALLSGASPSNVLDGLAVARSAPGRLEPVPTGREFALFVDYAHSQDALENVCRVLRDSLARHAPEARAHAGVARATARGSRSAATRVAPERAGSRLIVVFGCGGDRDAGKRAPMGAVVNELADVAIVTSDNPRSEDPDRIIEQIVDGMQPARAQRVVEPDRRRAIHRAVELARAGDVVLIAGKGHETTQTIGTRVLDFDDRKIALEALE
jgi:UDP-N-acetylmuramoyl-L-alanyl-D-glutamate--2,6-diaminopimelate ligase